MTAIDESLTAGLRGQTPIPNASLSQVEPATSFIMEAVQGLVRHGLTTAGGILMAHGYTLSATNQQVIYGAVMALIGVGWSVWNKRT